MIIFVDQNKKLCKLVKLALPKLRVLNKDILEVKQNFLGSKIVTASNPRFFAGGGLDALLEKEYSIEWKEAQCGKMTNNLFFVISVNQFLQPDFNLIKKALIQVLEASKYNTLLLTGLGTGIGGLKEKQFVKLLKEVLGE